MTTTESQSAVGAFSRRDFLKLSALGAGAIAWSGLPNPLQTALGAQLAQTTFPEAQRLGRVCVGRVELKARPDPESDTVGVLFEDAVLPWLNDVSGKKPTFAFNSQRWVETPQGYLYGPYVQPVANQLNRPSDELPSSSRGPGMWVEITTPYANAVLDREPADHSWVKFRLADGLPLRVYYSQVFWADQRRVDNAGNVRYRINPNYFGGIDMLWVPAEACRPISQEELAPISPEVEDKRVVIYDHSQMMSCFEGNTEVYFCRVSTGAKFDMYGNRVEAWATPLGRHRVTRKYVSLQMSGGTTGAGYDLPGIAWAAIFATGGVAVHSTFWHNKYGDPVSRGCINCTPQDAKWVWRWLAPEVPYDPGMIDTTVTGESSTRVDVVDR
jgi:lipoprotein-anchoring transpeptidase ErfK/SrfK